MTRQKTVTVEIAEDGTASVDLEGFQGVGCSAVLDEFIGPDKIKLKRHKREYSVEQTARQQQKAGQR